MYMWFELVNVIKQVSFIDKNSFLIHWIILLFCNILGQGCGKAECKCDNCQCPSGTCKCGNWIWTTNNQLKTFLTEKKKEIIFICIYSFFLYKVQMF